MPRPEWSLWGVRWSGGARFGFLESLRSRSSLRSWGEPGGASPTQRRTVHSSWDCPCHTWILCLLSNFLQNNFLVYGAGQGPLGSRASPVNFNSVSRCGHPPSLCSYCRTLEQAGSQLAALFTGVGNKTARGNQGGREDQRADMKLQGGTLPLHNQPGKEGVD